MKRWLDDHTCSPGRCTSTVHVELVTVDPVDVATEDGEYQLLVRYRDECTNRGRRLADLRPSEWMPRTIAGGHEWWALYFEQA